MCSEDINFPKSLNISPSTPTYSTKDEDKLHDVFGYSAQREAINTYGIAGRIWEAAYTLCLYINPPLEMQFDPPFVLGSQSDRDPLTILELGSGIGMTSAGISQHLQVDKRDILITTDLPEVCPLLKSNLQVYTSATSLHGGLETLIYVRPLPWGDENNAAAIASELLAHPESPRTLSHVICSDLVYFPELLAPLLRTLLFTTSPSFSRLPITAVRGPTVVISYKLRSLTKEAPFWSTFGLWFTFEPVLVSSGKGDWQRFGSFSSEDTIFVFVAHRRAESYGWSIPACDRDLLSGKGAMGNDLAKSDDTFEALLLMMYEIEG